eukprot:206542_1
MGVCTSKANRPSKTTNTINKQTKKYSVNNSQISSYDIVDQIENNPDPDFTILSDYNDDNVDTFSYYKNQTSNSIVSPTNHDEKTQLIENDIDEIDEFVYIPPSYNMTVGDDIEIITVDDNNLQYILHGIIRFIGHITNKKGIFYGIQTDTTIYNNNIWKHINKINGFPPNQNNGYVNKICYFKTTDTSNGLFVTKQQITRVIKVNYNNPRVAINEQIYIPQYKCNGSIKYIGKTQLKHEQHIHDICYGIQLNKCNNKNKNKLNQCNNYDILLHSTDLGHCIVASRYNLLIHGMYHSVDSKYTNITSGIIQLIQCYYNRVEITLISKQLKCKQYQLLDINNNICGPTITVKKCGSGTHCKTFETKICGHYQFFKNSLDDTDDNDRFVRKTLFEILKLENGKQPKKIFRYIDSVSYCDENELPVLLDFKSEGRRNRHNYHQNDVDDCDHENVLQDIACLYGLDKDQIKNHFGKKIQLYGLSI